jgi:hypothetical protein
MAKKKRKTVRAPNQATKRVSVAPAEVAVSSRYTPRQSSGYIFRPIWHKVIGGILLVSGLSLFVSCEADIGDIHAYGGHIWFLIGLAIAISSTWWFGLFDPPN